MSKLLILFQRRFFRPPPAFALTDCKCPGCGAFFNPSSSDEEEHLRAGYINKTALMHRIQFEQKDSKVIVMISADQKKKSSPFPTNDRYLTRGIRSEWRPMTRLEIERLERRAAMPPGQASQLLREGKGENSNITPKSSSVDLADEETSIDRAAFERLAKETQAEMPTDTKPALIPLICDRCQKISFSQKIKALGTNLTLQPILEHQLPLGRDWELLKSQYPIDGSSLIVQIVDATDLPLSFLPNLRRILRVDDTVEELKVIVLINKDDLLPANGKGHAETLGRYVQENWQAGPGCRLVGSYLASARTGHGLVELQKAICKEANGNVYLTGRTNVGKSSIYNALTGNSMRLRSQPPSTVAAEHGTTLGILSKKIANLSWSTSKRPGWLIDLPGVLAPGTMSPEQMEAVRPWTLNRPARNQRRVLEPGQKAIFGDSLWAIEYEGGKRTGRCWLPSLILHCFLHPSLPFRRSNLADSLEPALTLNIPISSTRPSVVLDELVLAEGLGWISLACRSKPTEFVDNQKINHENPPDDPLRVHIYTKPEHRGLLIHQRPPLRTTINN